MTYRFAEFPVILHVLLFLISLLVLFYIRILNLEHFHTYWSLNVWNPPNYRSCQKINGFAAQTVGEFILLWKSWYQKANWRFQSLCSKSWRRRTKEKIQRITPVWTLNGGCWVGKCHLKKLGSGYLVLFPFSMWVRFINFFLTPLLGWKRRPTSPLRGLLLRIANSASLTTHFAFEIRYNYLFHYVPFLFYVLLGIYLNSRWLLCFCVH